MHAPETDGGKCLVFGCHKPDPDYSPARAIKIIRKITAGKASGHCLWHNKLRAYPIINFS